MKHYSVWFIVKKNNHGYLHVYETDAANKKDAFQAARDYCRKQYNAHAFTMSTTGPKFVIGPNTVEYNGGVYTKSTVFGSHIILW